MNRLNRWGAAAALAAVAVLALVLRKPEESWLPAVAAAVVLLVLSWFISPFCRGRHAKRWQPGEAGAAPNVVIFWRPGCMYCLRLKAALGSDGRRATWVNIWRDEEAAGFVRAHNGGNETVPTVILGGEILTNPAPGLVRQALAAGPAR